MDTSSPHFRRFLVNEFFGLSVEPDTLLLIGSSAGIVDKLIVHRIDPAAIHQLGGQTLGAQLLDLLWLDLAGINGVPPAIPKRVAAQHRHPVSRTHTAPPECGT